MKKIILTLLVFISFSAPLSFAEDLNKSEDIVKCVIESEKEIYKIGESIKICFRLQSLKGRTIVRYPGTWLPPFYGLKIEHSEGKEVKYLGPIPPGIIPLIETELWKDVYLGKDDIEIEYDWYQLKPGIYTFYLERHFLKIDRLKYIMVKSNKIKIKIVSN